MRVIVYEKNEVIEPVLRLSLKQSGETVVLEAIDENGVHINGGNLLTIDAKGQLLLPFGVATDLGLVLDKTGRLAV